MEKINILFIQANTYASGYYRIGFIAEELKKDKRFRVDYYIHGQKADGFLYRMAAADIIVMQLQNSDLMAKGLPVIKANGIVIVMDMDDDLFSVPKWNPAYFGLGRNYIDKYNDMYGKKMDIAGNKKRLRNMRKILREVDLITVTGSKIRDAYSRYNKVKIIPNLVDPARIKPAKRSGGFFDKHLRIFWQGSSTHIKDLEMLKPAVKHITEKYPHVRWFIWGSMYDNFAENMEIHKDRVETKESVEMEDYYKNLKNIKMDIGICPLTTDDEEDKAYNECKSPIKFLEYSLCGIPSVVSDISTYTDTVIPNHTALVARTTQDWIDHLSSLIENPEDREILAQNAKEQVLRDFNLQTKIKLWADTFIKLHQDNPNKI